MKRVLRPAVFLDRDGVLNRTTVRNAVSHPPQLLEEFELLPGVLEALTDLRTAGFVLVVVTNQPDLATGRIRPEVAEAIHQKLRALLPIDDIKVCGHVDEDDCSCRKPRPGMLLDAGKRWGLDLTYSLMVGDRWSDIEAGQAAGCLSLLVVTPQSGRDRCRPDHCVESLAEAADWILTLAHRGHS